ncbi:MAG: ABC transporter permease, partial [Dehalococcoidia bacterium]
MGETGLPDSEQRALLRIMGEIHAIWLREMKRHWTEKGRLLAMFTPPLLWLGIIGIGFSAAFDLPEEVNLPYLDIMAPGIIAQVALLSAIVSGVSILMDRNFGFMREMLVAPVSRESILFGKLLGGVTIATINSLVLMVVAIGMGAIPLQQPLWHFGAA